MSECKVINEHQLFCHNVECLLHVRPGDPGVSGHGNWAMTSDGIVVSRTRVGQYMFCDRCARRVIAPVAALTTPEPAVDWRRDAS